MSKIKNINIRFATSLDGKDILEVYAPYVISTTVTFEYEVPTLAQFEERIKNVTESRQNYPYIVCEIDGHIAGFAYASAHMTRAAYQWGAQTSVYLAEGYHRRGIATSLYFCLLEILKNQGYYKAYAILCLSNESSLEFHKSCGFVPVGVFRDSGYKFGKWHDIMWLEKTLINAKEFPTPKPPRDIRKLGFKFIDNLFKKAKAML